MDFTSETSKTLRFPKNIASAAASITSSMEKNGLPPQLVLPVIKVEENINADMLTENSSDSDDYLIEESKNEVNFSLKTYVKSGLATSESEAGKPPNELQNSKFSEDTIKEEVFAETGFLIQEEVDIKSEDEESDEFNTKLEIGQTNKSHHPSSKSAPLNRISTNNRRFCLTEPSVFKCLNCTYQTHRKKYITRHVVNHMEKTFKCSHCSYKTSNKGLFREHERIHVPKGEGKLHHCPECPYASVRKRNLTSHMIKHKKTDDVTWYQCPDCPYKTKRKGNLIHNHMRVHKKDMPMHKCTLCPYESCWKKSLMRHLQHVHRPKDIQPIHCQEKRCSFKTYDKLYLERHITMMHQCKKFFKCSQCPYQTKYAKRLKEHKLGHEHVDKWFSCSLCTSFKTTSMCNLKRHMLVHKSGNEIKWFHCSECDFKTKRNISLRLHKLTHNIIHEKIIECSDCSYKTVHASKFRAHRLVHKRPEEISEWFYCFVCTYRSPRKRTLAAHIQKRHRDIDGRMKQR